MPFKTSIERRQAEAFGAQVASARKAKGLSQNALARILGIPQSRISQVELGTGTLSRDAIARAVGIYNSEELLHAHA